MKINKPQLEKLDVRKKKNKDVNQKKEETENNTLDNRKIEFRNPS